MQLDSCFLISLTLAYLISFCLGVADFPGPEAEHTTCPNRRGRFAGSARKLIIGVTGFGGGWWGGGVGGVKNDPFWGFPQY